MKIIRNLLVAGTASVLLATAVYAASAPNFAPIALNSLSSPPAKIATAAVVDEGGTVIGAVQKVNLDASGKASTVEIALLGTNHIVALDSSHLSYDQSANVVTAEMDKTQITELPIAPQR